MPKKRNIPKWTSSSAKLKPNHSWSAPDGYKIVVVDRGKAIFNVPEDWIIAKLDPHFEMHDAEPPDDEARLSVSVFGAPPGVDWTGLPLDKLLEMSINGMDKQVETIERSPITTYPREDIEVVWAEQKFIDATEKRPAFTRVTIARGFDVHVLVTMDYWENDAERIRPVWAEIVRSLQLGKVIQDPTKGEMLH